MHLEHYYERVAVAGAVVAGGLLASCCLLRLPSDMLLQGWQLELGPRAVNEQGQGAAEHGEPELELSAQQELEHNAN